MGYAIKYVIKYVIKIIHIGHFFLERSLRGSINRKEKLKRDIPR